MSEKTAVLKVKSTASLPQMITLPLMLSRRLDIPRTLTITSRSQLVPEAVAQWLLDDPRYSRWLDAEFEEEQVASSAPASKPKPKPKPKAKQQGKSKNPPKPPQDPSHGGEASPS